MKIEHAAKRQETSRVGAPKLRKSVKFTTTVHARGVNFEFTQTGEKFTHQFTQMHLHPVTLFTQSRRFRVRKFS